MGLEARQVVTLVEWEGGLENGKGCSRRVPQACSLCENSSSCTFMNLHVYVYILQLKVYI